MQEPDIERLTRKIEQAGGSFNRLVLLAGHSGSGKTDLLRQVCELRACPFINVNLQLSQQLLELPCSKRPRLVDRIFGELLDECEGDLVGLDNLEVLFDRSLQVDPLRLLKGHSRNRTLIATWNGTFQDGMLSYAEPDHPEYRSYRNVDAITVLVGKKSLDN